MVNHLNRIIERNFGKSKVTNSEEMRLIYQDVGTLAKCIRLLEGQGSNTTSSNSSNVEIKLG
jgi:hypothetical protein